MSTWSLLNRTRYRIQETRSKIAPLTAPVIGTEVAETAIKVHIEVFIVQVWETGFERLFLRTGILVESLVSFQISFINCLNKSLIEPEARGEAETGAGEQEGTLDIRAGKLLPQQELLVGLWQAPC